MDAAFRGGADEEDARPHAAMARLSSDAAEDQEVRGDASVRTAALQTAALAWGYFSLGLGCNGPLGPRLRKLKELALPGHTASASGWFVARGVGAMIGALMLGGLFDRVPSRPLFTGAVVAMALALLAVPAGLLLCSGWVEWFTVVLVSQFVCGVTLGVFDSGGNTAMSWLWVAVRRPHLTGPAIQLLHFSFGVGSVCTGVAAAATSAVTRLFVPGDEASDRVSFFLFFALVAVAVALPALPLAMLPSVGRPRRAGALTAVVEAPLTVGCSDNEVMDAIAVDGGSSRLSESGTVAEGQLVPGVEMHAMEQESGVCGSDGTHVRKCDGAAHVDNPSQRGGVAASDAADKGGRSVSDGAASGVAYEEVVGAEGEAADEDDAKEDAPGIITALLSLLLLVYVGAEVGWGAIISDYVQKPPLEWSREEASLVQACYWFTFTAGRGVGIPLSARLSPVAIITLDISLCFAALAVFVLWPTVPAAVWFSSALLGIGMASIYPSAVTVPPHHGFRVSSAGTRLLVFGASAGELVVPTAIAFFVDTYPPAIGVGLVLAMAVVALLFAALVMLLRRRHHAALQGG